MEKNQKYFLDLGSTTFLLTPTTMHQKQIGAKEPIL